MLKVYATVYTDAPEKMTELAEALEKEGFEVAYSNDVSATIIKEVPDEKTEE